MSKRYCGDFAACRDYDMQIDSLRAELKRWETAAYQHMATVNSLRAELAQASRELAESRARITELAARTVMAEALIEQLGGALEAMHAGALISGECPACAALAAYREQRS